MRQLSIGNFLRETWRLNSCRAVRYRNQFNDCDPACNASVNHQLMSATGAEPACLGNDFAHALV
jgi:hypothetical protein